MTGHLLDEDDPFTQPRVTSAVFDKWTDDASRKENPVVEMHICEDMSMVCSPVGTLDWIGAVPLRHVIHDSLRPGVQVVIDLSQVDDIDAVGMSALVGSIRRVHAAGGHAEIRNPTRTVRRRLELVGIHPLFMGQAATDNDAA